ncbi:hypothetical protein PENSPDRAFT_683313 [Peniophora sp. CONT]|nr:hypothetical protein PENSPDRAFT_683313 [Peniophora sp. CONT]
MSTTFLRDLREQPAATVTRFRNLLLEPLLRVNNYTALKLATEFRDRFVRGEDAAEIRSAWSAVLVRGLLETYASIVSVHDFFERQGCVPTFRTGRLPLDEFIRLPDVFRVENHTALAGTYAEGVRGEDAVDHFAQGVKFMLTGSFPASMAGPTIRDHIDLILDLGRIRRAQRSEQVYTSSTELVESMRVRANEIWRPNLRDLQAMENRRSGPEATAAKSD